VANTKDPSTGTDIGNSQCVHHEVEDKISSNCLQEATDKAAAAVDTGNSKALHKDIASNIANKSNDESSIHMATINKDEMISRLEQATSTLSKDEMIQFLSRAMAGYTEQLKSTTPEFNPNKRNQDGDHPDGMQVEESPIKKPSLMRKLTKWNVMKMTKITP
jgi:hypothetical protein